MNKKNEKYKSAYKLRSTNEACPSSFFSRDTKKTGSVIIIIDTHRNPGKIISNSYLTRYEEVLNIDD